MQRMRRYAPAASVISTGLIETAARSDQPTPARLRCSASCFYRCNAPQQAAQQVRPSDDASLRAPDQDQIVVDNIIVRALLHDFQVPDNLAKSRPHLTYNERPVPTRALRFLRLFEQGIPQEMMGIQHERRLTCHIRHNDPLLAGCVDLLEEGILGRRIVRG